jgi:hypothetical protein
MRGIGAVVAVVVLSTLLGCATETTEPGSSTSGLEWVRKADYVGQVLYYDTAISARPLTAEEMGDTTWATPVMLAFYDDLAVAYWAPDGHGLFGDEEAVVDAWAVIAHAQTTSGDVAPGTGDTGTRSPSDGVETGGLLGDFGQHGDAGVEIENRLPFAKLDWLRRLEDIPFIPSIDPIHPGCIEE